MAGEVWIVYKADEMDAPGWEARQLMPGGGITDILEENWSSEAVPTLPKPGDRTTAIAGTVCADSSLFQGIKPYPALQYAADLTLPSLLCARSHNSRVPTHAISPCKFTPFPDFSQPTIENWGRRWGM